MRKSPQDAGHAAIPLLLLLVLCVLFMALTPVASALSNAAESNDGYLAVSAMHSSEDGKVTDDDGRIGNGHSGADHAEPNDPFQNGITGGAERGADDITHGAEDMARDIGDAAQGEASMEDGTADDGNSSGILPWIIASIVVVAVVLVILALIPNKNRSH
jgi:hypothetical protein